MKILFINTWLHPKNLQALQKYNIHFVTINNTDLNNIDLNDFDAVYSPTTAIDVSKYPNMKFVFGPHFSVFPVEQDMELIKGSNTVYIQPSEWVVDLWNGFEIIKTKKIKILPLPFSVDTDRFCEIKPVIDRDLVFIYFKNRDPNELEFISTFCKNNNIQYRLFECTRYSEGDYLNYIQNSKYGIWIDGTESQGFALQEALSCNVPLLVWNVTSMKQMFGSNYDDIFGTSIPYWDDSCGEFFYDSNEFQDKFNLFQSKLHTYNPRQFILDNLSSKKCEEKFINIVNSIYPL